VSGVANWGGRDGKGGMWASGACEKEIRGERRWKIVFMKCGVRRDKTVRDVGLGKDLLTGKTHSTHLLIFVVQGFAHRARPRGAICELHPTRRSFDR
jgi:hypothetical protein